TLLAREDSRGVWIWPSLDQLTQDIRYGFRLLNRNRGFAALSILTIAAAIGVVTTLFSVTYGVLLKPLPWPEADRLIRLTESRQGATRQYPLNITNGPYLAWRDHPTTRTIAKKAQRVR